MPARWAFPAVIAALLLWSVARTFTALEAADLGDTFPHFMKNSRYVREFGFSLDDAYHEDCLLGERSRYPIHRILGWGMGGQVSQLSLHTSEGRQLIGLKRLVLIYPRSPSPAQREHLAYFMRERHDRLGGGESLTMLLAAFLDNARTAYLHSEKRSPVHEMRFGQNGLLVEFRTILREYEQELSVTLGLPDAQAWAPCAG